MATLAPALEMRVALVAVGAAVAAAVVVAVMATPPTAAAGGRALVAAEAPRPTRAVDALQGRSSRSEAPAGGVAPLLRPPQTSALAVTLTAWSRPCVLLLAWDRRAGVPPGRCLGSSMILWALPWGFALAFRPRWSRFVLRAALLLMTAWAMPGLFLLSPSTTMSSQFRWCPPAPHGIVCACGCWQNVASSPAFGGFVPLAAVPSTGVGPTGVWDRSCARP
jgi:hypothetical protein